MSVVGVEAGIETGTVGIGLTLRLGTAGEATAGDRRGTRLVRGVGLKVG